MFTWVATTLVYVFCAVDPAPPHDAGAFVCVGKITASGAVRTRRRHTFIGVHAAVFAFPSNVTRTRIAVNCIGARAVLTWLGVTLVIVHSTGHACETVNTRTHVGFRGGCCTPSTVLTRTGRALVDIDTTVGASETCLAGAAVGPGYIGASAVMKTR